MVRPPPKRKLSESMQLHFHTAKTVERQLKAKGKNRRYRKKVAALIVKRARAKYTENKLKRAGMWKPEGEPVRNKVMSYAEYQAKFASKDPWA